MSDLFRRSGNAFVSVGLFDGGNEIFEKEELENYVKRSIKNYVFKAIKKNPVILPMVVVV